MRVCFKKDSLKFQVLVFSSDRYLKRHCFFRVMEYASLIDGFWEERNEGIIVQEVCTHLLGIRSPLQKRLDGIDGNMVMRTECNGFEVDAVELCHIGNRVGILLLRMNRECVL